MSIGIRTRFDSWRGLAMFIIGFMILQFFIALVCYQVGWENRAKFNNEQLNASIAFDYCIKNKRIKYGNDTYVAYCYLLPKEVKKK